MLEFRWRADDEGILLAGVDAGEPVGFAAWTQAASAEAGPVVVELQRLLDCGAALTRGEGLSLSHATAADLSETQRRILGLPEAPNVSISVQHRGAIDSDAFQVDYAWNWTSGRPVIGARRQGAILQIGDQPFLLSRNLLEIAELIEEFNRLPGSLRDERMAAWMRVQHHLPVGDEPAILVDASRYLRQTRIAFAVAFSLHPYQTSTGLEFDPLLFGMNDEAPLLSAEQQNLFARARFTKAVQARGRYLLDRGWILVLSTALQKALDVVRRAQLLGGAPAKDFVLHPRESLRTALGGAVEECVLQELFRETDDYMARVRSMGDWAPIVLPWVQVTRTPGQRPPAFGLVIDGVPILLSRVQLAGLLSALANREGTADHALSCGGAAIPLTEETTKALQALEVAVDLSNEASPLLAGGQ